MRQLRTSEYAISRLLGHIVEQSGLSRSAFVQSLGYKNVAKGLRALDAWLETAHGSGFVLENLVKVHHLDPVVLRNALEETGRRRRRQEEQASIAQEKHDREHFRPYVFVETNPSRPVSIAIAAFIGMAMKFVRLTGRPVGAGKVFEDLPEPEQLAFVQSIVREHYVVEGGKCPLFGDITGYRYVRTYDQNLRLTIHGEIVLVEDRHFEPGSTSITVGNKTLNTTNSPWLRRTVLRSGELPE